MWIHEVAHYSSPEPMLWPFTRGLCARISLPFHCRFAQLLEVSWRLQTGLEVTAYLLVARGILTGSIVSAIASLSSC